MEKPIFELRIINNVMTTRDKLICLKNIINDALEKESMNYYEAMDLRKYCVEVENAIDDVFEDIKIDLNI